MIFRKESHNAIMQKTKPRSLQILKPSPASPPRHLKPYKQQNFSPFLFRPFLLLVAHEMETETVTGETETDTETGKEAPAIRALGSLFRITQVFLWFVIPPFVLSLCSFFRPRLHVPRIMIGLNILLERIIFFFCLIACWELGGLGGFSFHLFLPKSTRVHDPMCWFGVDKLELSNPHSVVSN